MNDGTLSLIVTWNDIWTNFKGVEANPRPNASDQILLEDSLK